MIGMASDVPPVVTFHDAPHAALGQGVHFGDLWARPAVRGEAADFQNIGLLNLCQAALLALHHGWNIAAAASLNAVAHIVHLRSGVEMLRIHARWVVAVVKCEKLSERLSELDLKGNAVSQQRPPVVRNDAISLACARSAPGPAFVLAKALRSLELEVARQAAKRLDFPLALKDIAAGTAWSRFQSHDPDYAVPRLCGQGVA